MIEIGAETPFGIKWEFEDYTYLQNFQFVKGGMNTEELTYLKGEILLKPESLFKFYGKSDYSINALLENYLYYSNPRDFNDPFDCLTNREKFILQGGDGITAHRNNIGICCFSLKNDNPLLWGHYTNSYTGFCLKFGNTNFLKNKNVQISRPISYLKNYQPANENLKDVIEYTNGFDINQEEKDLIQKVITMTFEYTWKFYDWKYEQEYRSISMNSNSFNRKFKFDPKVITEVYIGHRMKIVDPNYYNLLIHILRNNYPNTKIFEVKPHPLIVKLEFEPLS
jgi:hypothetical protein